MATLRKEIKRSPYVNEMAAYYLDHEWGKYDEMVEPLLSRLNHWRGALEEAETWDLSLFVEGREWVAAAQDICMGLLSALGGLEVIAADDEETFGVAPDPGL